jgi:hypothetical protein
MISFNDVCISPHIPFPFFSLERIGSEKERDVKGVLDSVTKSSLVIMYYIFILSRRILKKSLNLEFEMFVYNRIILFIDHSLT